MMTSHETQEPMRFYVVYVALFTLCCLRCVVYVALFMLRCCAAIFESRVVMVCFKYIWVVPIAISKLFNLTKVLCHFKDILQIH